MRRLADRDLVARQNDPDDRRTALLTLSTTGRRQLDEIDEVGANLFGRALARWPDADRQTLATLIHRLTDELAVVPHDHVKPHRPPR